MMCGVLPNHNVRVEGPNPIEGAPGDMESVDVWLIPAADPRLQLIWRYTLQGGELLHPCAMAVEPASTVPVSEWAHVGPTLVRDLPLARIERAARMMAEFSLRRGTDRPPLGPSWGKPPAVDEIPEIAEAMVRERHPDLDPKSGAGASRRWKRLVRLAEVVQEQQVAQARGEKSPTAVIAKARGVAPATVRGWLHQANQEGFAARPYFAGLDVFNEIAPANPHSDASAED